jgi:hypothetical protein
MLRLPIARFVLALALACSTLAYALTAFADMPPTATADRAVAVPPPQPEVAVAPSERLSFAVVIGNNKSLGNRRAELHYADDDAARYFEILQTMAPGRVSLLADFDRDTQRLFPTARAAAVAPSLRNLHVVGRRLAEQVSAAHAAGHETDLYFIFAGHGDVLQGEGFIELAEARFFARDLTAWLSAIPFSRAHVILDSCNSFFMLGPRKPGGRHFATSEDASRALAARLPNVGVFLSTSADGEAFEWSEIQSGIFSHVVRSGLLGAADANADGQVSYLELAAFVDTATSEVRNPNMRPHVYARGPGAQGSAAIADLQSMTGVRRFALGEPGPLRIRLRDANGLPLVDAHSENAQQLRLAVPESWTRGSVLERVTGGVATALYGVPDPPGTVTLAALEAVTATRAGRGPGEAFEPLFLRPFGPRALGEYQATERQKPPAVFGVSREDTLRMQLLLDQLASVERGKRISESIGGLGFGVLLGGAGVGLLHVDAHASRSDKREARILGGSLLGLGGVMVIGGTGSLLATGKAEVAAGEFRRSAGVGQDSTQAFVHADEVVKKLIDTRRQERLAEGIVGTIAIVGCATGLTLGEIATHGGGHRMARRLGWGGGMLGGAMMLGDAVWMEQPVDALARIWRQDPSLNQYQAPTLTPSFSVGSDGAFIGLSGSL